MRRKFSSLQKAPFILCGALVFLLFFGPILKRWQVIPILLIGLSGKVVASKKAKRYLLHFIACLFIPVFFIIAAYFVGLLGTSDRSVITSVAIHVGIVAFLVLYAIDAVAELMASRQTNVSEVLSTLNTYLIFGLIYGEIYALIAHFQPGSFNIVDAIAKNAFSRSPMFDSWAYIYFSFITQTSLGYGDMTPVSHLSQVFVISQAIFGQFYIAIVLAYLLHNYIVNDE